MSGQKHDDWLRDPAEITRKSFEIISQEADFSHLPPDCHHIAARIIHACGLPEQAANIRISPGLQEVAGRILTEGGDIFVDTEMVRAGIMRSKLPQKVKVHCFLRNPEVQELAHRTNTTLTASVVKSWKIQPGRAICIIGNAPTALFQLLERMKREGLRPAAVLGFPVGFVGAAESKQALHQELRSGLPAATMLGRAGGAGMAVAAFNAMLLRWHEENARS